MSERTPGGLVYVDDEHRDELMRPVKRPPQAKPASIPSFSTGRRINVRLASEYFVTDAVAWLVELDAPVLLMTTVAIRRPDPLIPLLENCARAARPIAIGAPSIGVDALVFLLANKLRGILSCAAFEAEPSVLEDISMFAGGRSAFADPEGVTLVELPRADKVVLSPTGLSIRPHASAAAG